MASDVKSASLFWLFFLRLTLNIEYRMCRICIYIFELQSTTTTGDELGLLLTVTLGGLGKIGAALLTLSKIDHLSFSFSYLWKW